MAPVNGMLILVVAVTPAVTAAADEVDARPTPASTTDGSRIVD